MRVDLIVVSIIIVMTCAIPLMRSDVEYRPETLSKFGSYEELKTFISWGGYYSGSYFSLLPRSSSAQLKSMNGLEYSATNVQVQGVDEADVVKTDGEYAYLVSGQNVIVAKAYPAEEAKVLSKIAFNGTPNQIFVNNDRLVVFCQDYSQSGPQTHIIVYDLSDRQDPMIVRSIDADGYYFSSRMAGEYIYAIIQKPAWVIDDQLTLPAISSNGECYEVSASEVYHTSIDDYSYFFSTIVSFNVQTDEQEPVHETILTGGSTELYVSMQNIYLAVIHGDETILHRIQINDGVIQHANDGLVPGDVLNQFSMDENKGYFRIATTSRANSLLNNLYVLNMKLEVVGKIEGIAPGESIHSARFMGDTCYLVTFKKIDPFFVIDISNPYEPKILGELKIPGYSDYLHPYDENHIIGVGKETVEAEGGNFAWYQGLKIALFDVSTVSKPEQLGKYEIGDRGTDSPILQDHKAFLFDKQKNLLVIPASIAEINESRDPRGILPNTYGELVWQGACVFAISLDSEEKIMLRGTISHIEDGNLYNNSNYIVRAFYIEDVLYTISESSMKMNSLVDLTEIKELSLNG